MKKEYEIPEIIVVALRTDRLLDTDSEGLDDDFGAKGNNFFEEEESALEDNQRRRSLWDE